MKIASSQGQGLEWFPTKIGWFIPCDQLAGQKFEGTGNGMVNICANRIGGSKHLWELVSCFKRPEYPNKLSLEKRSADRLIGSLLEVDLAVFLNPPCLLHIIKPIPNISAF